MPHSSGGGSHGGGSHGGSHGGSRGGSSGFSRTYFSGCQHRYVYYKRKKPHYVYSNKSLQELSKPSSIASKIFMTVFLIPFIYFGFLVLTSAFPKAIPIALDYPNQEITIEDSIGVIGNEEELYQIMERFQQETGVTPSILTVYDDVWNSNYTSLENYAYDIYVNKYNDEKHWLIIYSQPEGEAEFVAWSWEGMQGDETDSAITLQNVSHFNDGLQDNLLRNNKSVDEAFVLAYERFLEKWLDRGFEKEVLFFAMIWFAFIGFFLYNIWLSDIIFARRMAMAQEIEMARTKMEEHAQEIKCDYCDGIYVKNPYYRCPHCGAPSKQELE